MKERLLWLDCLKGFAILLVVLGHCIHTMVGPGETLWGGVLYLIYSYYNKFGQESRTASPAFPPSRA